MRVTRIVVLVPILLCGAAMAIGQTVWDQYPGNPVLGPGDPGSWDEFARVDPTVLFDGSVYHMWFAGYDGAFIGGGFGHATSLDGVEWTLDPNNPVLTPGDPGRWDEFVWNHPAGSACARTR